MTTTAVRYALLLDWHASTSQSPHRYQLCVLQFRCCRESERENANIRKMKIRRALTRSTN